MLGAEQAGPLDGLPERPVPRRQPRRSLDLLVLKQRRQPLAQALEQVRVEGHTDSTGSAQVNTTLSQQRADNVAKFLVEVGGISASRIMATGYGSERPVASNETPEGRAANRRVEILIRNP